MFDKKKCNGTKKEKAHSFYPHKLNIHRCYVWVGEGEEGGGGAGWQADFVAPTSNITKNSERIENPFRKF